MSLLLAPALRGYKPSNIPNDVFSGLIIALVSVPISMGYAQIAGLPAVYGLYGSIFPVLVFSLLSTSKYFVFGVDAAPAALVGGALVSLGIEGGSAEAVKAVPVITFFVSVWLLLFWLIRAEKLVSYISEPVMGGFISGICTTIILMQLPKIFGSGAASGELVELSKHLFEAVRSANVPSVLLGASTLAILIISRRFIPKFPMSVVLMIAGAVGSALLPFEDWGIQTLSAVQAGFPKWQIPEFSSVPLTEAVMTGLSIAVVITAETLLAENNFARKAGLKIIGRQELFAFFAGNLLASFTGCCPINGSVSRSSMNEQYKAKTQLSGIVAGFAMILIILFAARFIKYLPTPVLAAIVISALLSAIEFDLAAKLFRISKKEFLIFIGAFVGVLVLGTINGVLIGIILSFAEVIFRSSKPARYYIGMQPGHKHFRNLKDSSVIFPVKGVVIYKFCSSLIFSNADVFVEDIENGIKSDSIAVIVDASAIGSIDITGAGRLAMLYSALKERGVRFYLTEHISELNDQLRALGLGYMIEEGAVRRTIQVALKDLGITKPYPLEGSDNQVELTPSRRRAENSLHEFSWAFGEDADRVIAEIIRSHRGEIQATGSIETIIHGWRYVDPDDEEEWLDHLEEHSKELSNAAGKDEKTIIEIIKKHRR